MPGAFSGAIAENGWDRQGRNLSDETVRPVHGKKPGEACRPYLMIGIFRKRFAESDGF